MQGSELQHESELLVAERVKKYLPIVSAEIEREGVPFPPALVLSVIHAESRGKAGEVNPNSGASGLMQIMPIALRDYNQRNETDLKMSAMKGTDDQSIVLQIRVGIDLLGWFWKRAYGYLKPRIGSPTLDDLAQIAQLFYVAGPTGARKFLDRLEQPTFAQAAQRFPDWSGILYVKKVWRLTGEQSPVWDMDAVDRWVSGETVPEKPPLIAKTHKNGLLLAILVVAVASSYLKKK